MLYRTSVTEEYLTENKNKPLKTSDYFLRLCKKYNIFAGSSYEITNFEKLQLFIS
jgi:hypothetical protein